MLSFSCGFFINVMGMTANCVGRSLKLMIHQQYQLLIMASCCMFCLLVICIAMPPLACGISREEVREAGLVGTFYYEKSRNHQPPVIFFGGSSGGNFYDNYQNYPEDLVKRGYAVLTLAYFDFDGIETLPNMLRHIPLEYFGRAISWLNNRPETAVEGVAVIGNSRGGEVALLLATHYPSISTVIAIVPSAYVGSAYNGGKPVAGAAWTLHGKEIPYVDYQDAVIHYDPWWTIVDNLSAVQPFAIRVEKMSAALLLLSGEKDKIWPSTKMSKRIVDRLEMYQYPFPYKHISYDAGHNIRMESWPDVLQFLRQHYPASQ